MKTYLECVKEAASVRNLKAPIKTLYFELPQELIETLKEAADMYASQSNSHKQVVSGKRLIQLQIDSENVTIHLNQICRALEQIQAACASGAVDKTVSDGKCKHCGQPRQSHTVTGMCSDRFKHFESA